MQTQLNIKERNLENHSIGKPHQAKKKTTPILTAIQVMRAAKEA